MEAQRRRRPQPDVLGHLVDRSRGRLQALLRGQDALMAEPAVRCRARLVAEAAGERPRGHRGPARPAAGPEVLPPPPPPPLQNPAPAPPPPPPERAGAPLSPGAL